MRWFTHQGIGVGLAVVAARALDAEAAALVAGAWVGSLLPDVDMPRARVHRRTRLERRRFVARAAGHVVRLPLWLGARLRHRGITHSLLACALVTWVAVATGVVGLAIGYVAHVAADACTPAGVSAFAPFSRRAAWLLPRAARIRTGSPRELLFGLAFLAACAAVTLP